MSVQVHDAASAETTFGTRLEALSHGGAACNATMEASDSASESDQHNHPPAGSFAAGVMLSMSADIIIAVSLCIQKLAHNRNCGPHGKPLRNYACLPLYWVARLLNLLGEGANMLAYGLAPASVVAPVGCVGVLANEIIAVAFLKEPLRRRDVIGIVFVMVGVAMVVFAVPASEVTLDVHELLSVHVILAQHTYWYLIGVLLFLVFVIIILEPRFAHETVMVWMVLCALLSSVSVMATRGWASLVTQIAADCTRAQCVHGVMHGPCEQTVLHWLFWVLLALIVLTACWSLIYLNRAMQVFGNTEVVPVYYCTFTLTSVVGAAVVYDEFARIVAWQAIVFACGIACAILGVAVLMSARSGRHGLPVRDGVEPDDEEEEHDSDESTRFIYLAPEEKVEALERQTSASKLFGGVGHSLLQASVDTEIATDHEAAVRTSEEANYVPSLYAANRIIQRRPLPLPTLPHRLPPIRRTRAPPPVPPPGVPSRADDRGAHVAPAEEDTLHIIPGHAPGSGSVQQEQPTMRPLPPIRTAGGQETGTI